MDKKRFEDICEGLNSKPQTIGNHRLYFISFESAIELLKDRVESDYPEIEATIGNITLHLVNKESAKTDKVILRVAKEAMKELGIEYESKDNKEASNKTIRRQDKESKEGKKVRRVAKRGQAKET